MSGRRTIGVLGGMGPAATIDFLSKLLSATPAQRDQDHLRVLVDSNPMLPDRNAAIAGLGPSPGPELARMAESLERSGAEAVVMACNTAHYFQAEIEAALSVPFLSMIEATADAVLARSPSARQVGLLAAAGCIDAGLYQRAFAARGVETLVVDRSGFMAVLARIKAGDTGGGSRVAMRSLALALVEQGADALAAACTEVPLVLSQPDVPVPLTDSTAALVGRALAFATA
jgi:aspartate racemase